MIKVSMLLNVFFMAIFGLTACDSSVETNKSDQELPSFLSEELSKDVDVLEVDEEINEAYIKKAYFASGCFWCVEAIFESVKGVKEVYNGYSGGHTTGHAEAVEILYDSTIVSFKDLVDVYFGSQNIEQVNGQGPDHGSQYRSIAFYSNNIEKEIIDKKIVDLEATGLNVASEVKRFDKFWMGEGYHQNYERLHPNSGYIRSVSIPRLNKFQANYPNLLKSKRH